MALNFVAIFALFVMHALAKILLQTFVSECKSSTDVCILTSLNQFRYTNSVHTLL